jgi:hypothetical protein
MSGGHSTDMAKSKDYGTGIPKHEIESLARCLFPEIQRYFESEEGKREFEEWRINQAKTGKDGK